MRVYLSYARSALADAALAGKLSAGLRAAGGRAVEYSDPRQGGAELKEFMDGAAPEDRIVLILSDAFFKSEPCLAELHALPAAEYGRLRALVLEGTDLTGAEAWVARRIYWEARRDVLRARLTQSNGVALAPLARQFEYVQHFCGWMADHTSLPRAVPEAAAVRVDADAAELLSHLSEAEPLKEIPVRRPAREFRDAILAQLELTLAQHPELADELQIEAAFNNLDSAPGLPVLMCRSGFSYSLKTLLHPATENLLARLVADSVAREAAWQGATTVLAWLYLFGMSGDWVEERARGTHAPLTEFSLVIDTQFGAERIAAHFAGAAALDAPAADTREALDDVLQAIWSHFVPERSVRAAPSAADLEKLALQLGSGAAGGAQKCYIPLADPLGASLRDTGLAERLLACMPGAVLVIFHTEAGTCLLRLGNGFDSTPALRNFLGLHGSLPGTV
ncbi:MAG: toll/interleukin-1 receptor domain-containing protein [Rhodocyclaceae bacterium]|nr:toll/interleukin-1 receptor domain-containing protein [Rhodocyclaceae bacterium]MBX3670371.1 toll/interleukin-1 receptor domain-containing protein [Rhodocyclaceae bacterium]